MKETRECLLRQVDDVLEYLQTPYLMFNGFHRFGLTHSPKCPCNDRHNKEEDKENQ